MIPNVLRRDTFAQKFSLSRNSLALELGNSADGIFPSSVQCIRQRRSVIWTLSDAAAFHIVHGHFAMRPHFLLSNRRSAMRPHLLLSRTCHTGYGRVGRVVGSTESASVKKLRAFIAPSQLHPDFFPIPVPPWACVPG